MEKKKNTNFEGQDLVANLREGRVWAGAQAVRFSRWKWTVVPCFSRSAALCTELPTLCLLSEVFAFSSTPAGAPGLDTSPVSSEVSPERSSLGLEMYSPISGCTLSHLCIGYLITLCSWCFKSDLSTKVLVSWRWEQVSLKFHHCLCQMVHTYSPLRWSNIDDFLCSGPSCNNWK